MTTAVNDVVDSLAEDKLRFVDVRGIRTRYYEDGAGVPLLLLSGGQFGALYSLDTWSLNLPALAGSFHVYALDKLGQGYTDNPRDDDHYTFEAVVDHAAAFIETLDLTGFHLVGHSRGGLLASLLAHRYPDRVRSLVVVDSGSAAPHDPTVSDLDIYAALGFLKSWDPDVTPTLETVAIEPRGQAYRPEQVTDDLLRRLLEIARLPKTTHAQRQIIRLADDVWNPSVTRCREQNLDRIDHHGFQVPTLVVWGMNDRTAEIERGRALFDRIAAHTEASQMYVLNSAGHCSFRDRPHDFNRVVSGFCSAA